MLARDGKLTKTPELIAAEAVMTRISRQNDAALDRAIEQLRTAFGPEEFARLETFVKRMPTSSDAGGATRIQQEVSR